MAQKHLHARSRGGLGTRLLRDVRARATSARVAAGGAASAIIAGVAVLLLVGAGLSYRSGGSPASATASSATLAPNAPFTLVAISPGSTASTVAFDLPLRLRFSQPLAASTPLPSLAPAVPGRWLATGRSSLTFVASSPEVPGTKVVLTVPGGNGGVRSVTGRVLARSQVASWTVKPGSVLLLQEILAQLGYLPVTWTPIGQGPPSPAMYAHGQLGVFSWRWASVPQQLQALWAPGQYTVVTRGAVMAFENAHGMTTDGVASPAVWAALFQALQAGQLDPYPYAYAMVSMASPENLVLWVEGADIYSSLANTGIPVSPTQPGTFPVYLRYTFQVMRGTNPDGSTYADPVSWVSYFNGGDAVHGFVRASYGWPQSLGCVELPPSHAAVVWPYMHIGTLVTVS